MGEVRVSAPGKVILAGEHAVVYGEPALVAALGLRCRVRVRWQERGIVVKDKRKDLSLAKFAVKECLKELRRDGGVEVMIESELAIGGMGSSASLGTAIVWAMMKGEEEEKKNAVVKKIEDKQHGNSSGVDQTIVREGGVLRYQKGKGFEKLSLDLPEFWLIDSGRPVESTGEMVELVSKKKAEYKSLFKRMGEISREWRVGLIKENQELLEKIGIVGEKAKEIVKEIEKAGGMAKVCGAGGVKRGSGIILAYHPERKKLKALVERKKWKYYLTRLGAEGVRDETS